MKRTLGLIVFVTTIASAPHAQPIPEPPLGSIHLVPLWTRLGDIYGEAGAVEVAVMAPDGKYIASGSKYDN